MRGMFRFGCGAAYGPHSYSANLEAGGLINSMDTSMRSLVYTQRSQGSEPRRAAEPLKTGLQEVFPGVRADESFDVFMLGVAAVILSFALLIGIFFISWITGLKGSSPTVDARQAPTGYVVQYVPVQTVQPAVQQYDPQSYSADPTQSVAPPPAPEFGQPASRPFYGPTSWMIVDR